MKLFRTPPISKKNDLRSKPFLRRNSYAIPKETINDGIALTINIET